MRALTVWLTMSLIVVLLVGCTSLDTSEPPAAVDADAASTPPSESTDASTPIGSTPIGSTPIGSTPLGSTPIGSNPVEPDSAGEGAVTDLEMLTFSGNGDTFLAYVEDQIGAFGDDAASSRESIMDLCSSI